MANSSGIVGGPRSIETFDTGIVKASGSAAYRVWNSPGAHMAFSVTQGGQTATRSLDYFIGSGAVGRSYVSRLGKFLFQAPVSYYTAAAKWDVSPGFEKANDVLLTRAVEPTCLRCHASGVQHLPGTANGYAEPAFQGGISCERCHGPGAAHIQAMRSDRNRNDRAIVNPIKLDPARRDSVCAQCHLSGASEIGRDRPLSAFQPGDLFSDYVAIFNWNSKSTNLAVNSHFERMTQSACRKAAGAKFWCGTCHSPHDVSGRPKDTAYYRDRCFQCHNQQSCTAPPTQRASAGDDCIRCHMPRTGAPTVKHAAFTDHSIPRKPAEGAAPSTLQDAVLVPMFVDKSTDRELGLAYADLALKDNNRLWGIRALDLLQRALAQRPNDTRVASQLGQLFDRMKNEQKACELYAQAVRVDPTAIAAKVNLGTCLAGQGRLDESIRLWTDVVERAPGMEGARLNLAVAQYQAGKIEAARSILTEGLKINPFSRRALELLKQLQSSSTP